MVHTKDIVKSLPLLAAILGKKYGIEVRIGGDSAYTNGKIIHLPVLPEEGDEQFMVLVRGLIDHEAAHIRSSELSVLQRERPSPVLKHLWNSLEDGWVEQRLIACYPGCKVNFRKLIEHFFMREDNVEEHINPAAAVLDAVLLTVRSWAAPAIRPHRDSVIAVVNRAYPGLWPQVEAVLAEARYSTSSQQNMDYAKRILFLLQHQANALPAKESEQQRTLQEQRKPAQDTPDAHGRNAATPEQPAHSGAIQPQSADRTEHTGQTDTQGMPRISACQAMKALLEGTEASSLPEQLGEKLKAALGEQNPLRQGIRIATVAHTKAANLSAADIAHCRAATTVLRLRLHRLLQAEGAVPLKPGLRGKLCGSALYRLAVHNPRIFLRRGEKPVLDTAVHLLLDSSGSMAGASIRLAVQSCYAVASSLQAIKDVNVAVTAFPGVETLRSLTVSPLVAHGQKLHTAWLLPPAAERLWGKPCGG